MRAAAARLRPVAAALVAGLAVWAGTAAVAPAPRAGSTAVRTVTDLPAGTALAPPDLEVVALDPAAVPAGALTAVDAALGRTPAVPLPAGTVLTPALLADVGDLVPAGTVALTVPVGDPVLARLLAPGTRVDVLGTGPDGAPATLARRALVLPTPAVPAGGGLLGDDAATPSALVAVAPAEARGLAAGLAAGDVQVVLVP